MPARSSSAMPNRFLKNILKNPKPKIMASQIINISISHLQSLCLFYGHARWKFQKIIEKDPNRSDGFNRLSPNHRKKSTTTEKVIDLSHMILDMWMVRLRNGDNFAVSSLLLSYPHVDKIFLNLNEKTFLQCHSFGSAGVRNER